MRGQVIPLESARRRPSPPRKLGEVYGRVVSMEHLSRGVMERQIQRQAAREMDLLNSLLRMNEELPPQEPSEGQSPAFDGEDLEY